MRIHCYDPAACIRLQTSLEERGLVYGTGSGYASLIAPASVYLSPSDIVELRRDVHALATLYRTTNTLYLASARGDAPPWIKTCAEQGLTSVQAAAQRLVAEAGLEPLMTRVDYVELSKNRRQVAEVQWKSGGPGLFFGHQDAYRQVFPFDRSTVAFGDLTGEYLDTLFAACYDKSGVVVNEVRSQWLNGEAHLCRAARSRGVHYWPLDRGTLSQHLKLSASEIVVSDGGRVRIVTVLRGRGFSDALNEDMLMHLALNSVERRIWVEAPFNFLYRQKWSLSLPFLSSLRGLFDDRLRAVIIPSALVLGELIDLNPIAAGIPENHRQYVVDVKSLDDLSRLPTPVRNRLVLKCASGVGELQSGGRGVFRISGSSAAAAKIVDIVRLRVLRHGEPWIIQPYVDQTYEIPVALPGENNVVQSVLAHARIMLFGGRTLNDDWRLHGAIGNFSKHWKVSGAQARKGEKGDLLGSAFTDVRLELDADHSMQGGTAARSLG